MSPHQAGCHLVFLTRGEVQKQAKIILQLRSAQQILFCDKNLKPNKHRYISIIENDYSICSKWYYTEPSDNRS